MEITSYLLGKKSSGGGSSGGGLDWSALGYSETPKPLIDMYNYSKQIQTNWDNTQTQVVFDTDTNLYFFPYVDASNITTMRYMFKNCSNLRSIALIDTSNCTRMDYIFNGCTNLSQIPQFDTSKVTNLQNFIGSAKLDDKSLNNVLKMCINVSPSYNRSKTLSELGFNSTKYPASKIQAMPDYQNFINAGWTIGYE